MRDNEVIRPTWRFFDGAVSISVSMLLAVLITECRACDRAPLLGYLKMLTERDDGTIIVATLLLFPTSIALYGGMAMFFAARETVKAWAEKRDMKRREEGHREGRREGRREERERIRREMAKLGAPLTPEQAEILAAEAEDEPE